MLRFIRSAAMLTLLGFLLAGPSLAQENPEGFFLPEKKKSLINQLENPSKTKDLASGVTDVQFFDFTFNESQANRNPSWVFQQKTVVPPNGWNHVAVCVSEYDFDFYPQERPFTYLGVDAGVKLTGSTLEVSAGAICRDINCDDPWRAHVKVMVIFY